MKLFSSVLAIALLVGAASTNSFADDKWLTREQIVNLAGENFDSLSQACNAKFIIPPKTLMKSALSGHIPNGDWRRHDATNGSCSLIGGKIPQPTVKAMTRYAKYIPFVAFDGTRLGQFKNYDLFGPVYKFRYYTTGNVCKNYAARARSAASVAGGCVKFANGCACAKNIVGRTGGIG